MDAQTEKMTQEQKALLRLILRSPDNGDGWRKVSAMLWPHVVEYRHPVLTEIDEENRFIRLTPEGETVLRYAL